MTDEVLEPAHEHGQKAEVANTKVLNEKLEDISPPTIMWSST